MKKMNAQPENNGPVSTEVVERVEPVEGAGSVVVDRLTEFHDDESGATTLEYALLLAAIGIPSYFIIQMTIRFLIDYYQMMTAVNALPFP